MTDDARPGADEPERARAARVQRPARRRSRPQQTPPAARSRRRSRRPSHPAAVRRAPSSSAARPKSSKSAERRIRKVQKSYGKPKGRDAATRVVVPSGSTRPVATPTRRRRVPAPSGRACSRSPPWSSPARSPSACPFRPTRSATAADQSMLAVVVERQADKRPRARPLDVASTVDHRQRRARRLHGHLVGRDAAPAVRHPRLQLRDGRPERRRSAGRSRTPCRSAPASASAPPPATAARACTWASTSRPVRAPRSTRSPTVSSPCTRTTQRRLRQPRHHRPRQPARRRQRHPEPLRAHAARLDRR